MNVYRRLLKIPIGEVGLGWDRAESRDEDIGIWEFVWHTKSVGPEITKSLFESNCSEEVSLVSFFFVDVPNPRILKFFLTEGLLSLIDFLPRLRKISYRK